MLPRQCLVQIVVLFIMCKPVFGLKCYQCSSIHDSGCYSNDLKKEYLRDCNKRSPGSEATPVCRVLSQIQYFTPDQDVSLVRECAYIYQRPLRCDQSRFSDMHFSLSCECEQDGCNRAITRRSTRWMLLISVWILVIK